MSGNAYVRDLILYLARRDRCHLFRYVDRDTLPAEARAVMALLPVYFESVEEDSVSDWNYVLKLAEASGVDLDPDLIAALIDAAGSAGMLTEVVVQRYIDMHYADSILAAAAKAATGETKGLSEIDKLLEEHQQNSVAAKRAAHEAPSSSFDDVLSHKAGTGIGWFLPSVEKLIGKVTNEFIIVASRPDGGKTTFLAGQAVHAAKEAAADEVVLWFNNEEAIRRVKTRVMCNALNCTQEYIEHDPIDAINTYHAKVGEGKIVFVDDADSVGKIERVIAKFKPAFIIIDQLYKVRGYFGKPETEAERFRQLCQWARNLAKHECPVLVSNQLDGTAEGDEYPSMNTLYGSKTGAQGEADVIVMIGRNLAHPDDRIIHTPKNKLTGRVLSTRVKLHKERARFEDV